MKDFQAIKEILLNRKDYLHNRLQLLSKDMRRQEGPLDQDLDEQAIALENDEVINALDKQGREELEKIKTTLGRMERGEFGVCMNCDEAIELSRLEALPHALTCIKCAMENEEGISAAKIPSTVLKHSKKGKKGEKKSPSSSSSLRS